MAGIFKEFFFSTEDLPEVILTLSLISSIGAFLNRHLEDFPIPVPVILFLLGCSFEVLSFTSSQVQRYANAIQWMSPDLFFRIFTPVVFFTTAFDMDTYMLQKLFWQILLISIPGFLVNYILVLWHLASVNQLLLKPTQWLLFSAILVSSDPMLTAAAIRDLGLSRSLISLINGESLMTSVISLITFTSIMDFDQRLQSKRNHTLAEEIVGGICSYIIASFLFGILSSKLIQFWMSTVFGDDVNHISLIFSILYLIFYICELVGMSGIFTLAIVGLLLNSTSFKAAIEETLLLEFWTFLSRIAFLMVFTFFGLLIPAHTYLYIEFVDIYYSLNIYLTLIVLRFLTLLLISPVLSRVGHEFSWRWIFIMVCSEMKGMPNINMALLLAYSDLYFGSDKEKSQILFHGVLVCLITLVVNRFILPVAVTILGLRDATSTKYKSVCCTFQHFQELTKSAASALKFDKDLANADWNMIEKAITLENPYMLNEEETTEHQKVKCPHCNKEIDEIFNTEAMELANRRLLSAQIASYQRQYRNEILSQSAVQVLVGAAESFGEKKGKCMSLDTIKNYSESQKTVTFARKLLLNWVYNTRKEKEGPSKYFFFRICHTIVFTEEFEHVGYLVILMNIFPFIISWISQLNVIYHSELKHTNYCFLTLYILEALLKLIAPKLLQIIDKRMSHQKTFWYGILKGYVQGEADIMTIIDQITSSKQIKQMLLKQVIRNMEHAIKELGYLEYDHPEIAVTVKTKEEINVMLNMATEILKAFGLKGIISKTEGAGINKLIMAKKKEVLDSQSIIRPLTVEEVLYHIPWLDKNKDYINFIQEKAKVVTFDCGNDIFEEGDEPKGIYIIISGMVKLEKSKPGLGIDQMVESKEKDFPIIDTDYMLSGEIIGEINCLTNEPMKYSATCKTVVETCFIPKTHLYDAFEQCSPLIKQKMWLKLGLAITARKIREHLSYEDWNYNMQLKLSNIYVVDIPMSTKTDIYDENLIYVILIHGAVEDCLLRKTYRAPFLIPITCHQIQSIEDFTKVVIIQTPINMKTFRRNIRKFVPKHKSYLTPGLIGSVGTLEEGIQEERNVKEDGAHSAATARSPQPCSLLGTKFNCKESPRINLRKVRKE
ncbi:solute carrier family 9 member C1 isoform X4 [Homo sapiens]|uniref:solute carrier family 9 member C1 isoform X4 n=1 Tax=Homo sapiens TaxID=9606 RepID=UPI0007DC4E0F|nr:sodium/hydrogen exchanger 10 isoform X4 [Homo sapiens]XP_054202292.1 sodium/hydrogen exchanger 10 isoform X4 [Homo sapiens]|eukprot:XP_016861736.1 sodium/hydrogen exchanger 10 isoform X4 [Homo sapiens]